MAEKAAGRARSRAGAARSSLHARPRRAGAAAVASSPLVPAGALVVLEAAARRSLGVPPGLELLRTKGYGDTEVGFYSKVAPSPEPPTPGPDP